MIKLKGKVVHHVRVVHHHAKRVVTHRITLTVIIWVTIVKASSYWHDCDLIFAALGGVFQDEIARFTDEHHKKHNHAPDTEQGSG